MAFLAIKTLTAALMTLLAISCAHGQSYDDRSTVGQVMDGVTAQLMTVNSQLRAENIQADETDLVRSIASIHVFRGEELQQISDPGLLGTQGIIMDALLEDTCNWVSIL